MMRQLPAEKQLQELVEMARIFEQQMREQCELAKAIYDKYEKRIRESREASAAKQEV